MTQATDGRWLAVIAIQAGYRRMKSLKMYAITRQAITSLQTWFRKCLAVIKFRKIMKIVSFLQRNCRRYLARSALDRMRSSLMLESESIKLLLACKMEVNQLYECSSPIFGSNVVMRRRADVVFDRQVVAFDVLKDINNAYPAGWLYSLAILSTELAKPPNKSKLKAPSSSAYSGNSSSSGSSGGSSNLSPKQPFSPLSTATGPLRSFGTDTPSENAYTLMDVEKIKYRLLVRDLLTFPYYDISSAVSRKRYPRSSKIFSFILILFFSLLLKRETFISLDRLRPMPKRDQTWGPCSIRLIKMEMVLLIC